MQRAIDSYGRSTDSAKSRLQMADSVLSDVVLRLQDAQTQTAAASNSFLPQSQREAIALQLEGIRDALLAAVNQQFRGAFVFSGTKVTSAPYAKDASGVVGAYQGNTQGQALDVDRARSVEVTFDGSALVSDLFDGFAQLLTAVRAGNLSGPGFTVADGMTKLDEAFGRATAMQSRIGGSLNAVDQQQARLQDLRRASLARKSSLEDANMAAAIVKMQQAETAHRAALGAVSAASRQSLLDYLS